MCSVPRLLICNEESFSPAQRPPIRIHRNSSAFLFFPPGFWAEEACLSSHHLPLSKTFKLTLKKNPSPQRNSTTAFHYLCSLAKTFFLNSTQDVLSVQSLIRSFSHSRLAAWSQWVLGRDPGGMDKHLANTSWRRRGCHSDTDLSLLSGSVGCLAV